MVIAPPQGSGVAPGAPGITPTWSPGPKDAVCLAATPGLARGSAGNGGVSDGWQDFNRNGAMTWTYPSAGPGNVALMGEAAAADGVLALAFSADPGGAHTLALESLAAGIDAARTACTAGWEAWAATLAPPPGAPGDPAGLADALTRSAAVIKAHGDHSYPGAFVASLSTPWGDTRSDLSGYHLVWPRDATEAGFALLAVGHADDAASLLEFLISTQQADGHWEQNFFPDGTTFWSGTQLDETALPVMLAAKLADEGHPLPAGSDTMVRDALGFLVSNGPLTQEDRWEEDPGGSPFTLGVTICALVAGAGFLARAGATSPLSASESAYVLALADNWNERIESWTYATGSDLDAKYNIPGHYIRIGAAPNGDPNAAWGPRGFIPIKNQPGATSSNRQHWSWGWSSSTSRGSVSGPLPTSGCSTRSRSSKVRSARPSRPDAPITATTTMVTAKRTTAARSLAQGSEGCGRCSRASAATSKRSRGDP
jgi:glucoamylase